MWEVKEWTISGVKTGYRVVRGTGWNMEVAQGFVGDIYVPGSFEIAYHKANKLAASLNRQMIHEVTQ